MTLKKTGKNFQTIWNQQKYKFKPNEIIKFIKFIIVINK